MFDVHTQFVGTFLIMVWTKRGDYTGFENGLGGWTLIYEREVLTAGRALPTPLGRFDTDVEVTMGESQSFRVSITGIIDPILYTNGVGEGTVYASNDDLEIEEGRGCGPITCTNEDRIWNGAIYYQRA